jgi:hypothetical protein
MTSGVSNVAGRSDVLGGGKRLPHLFRASQRVSQGVSQGSCLQVSLCQGT